MDAKLTLKLDQKTIEKAKQYASEKKNHDDMAIAPFVKSSASGTNVPADYDHKKEYSSYLAEKYK